MVGDGSMRTVSPDTRMWIDTNRCGIAVDICATHPIVLEDKSGQITRCRSVIHFIFTLKQSINLVTLWGTHTGEV